MKDANTVNVFNVISCPSCTHEISVDAVRCPQCGRDNTWLHPVLVKVISHLETLERETFYEGIGHSLRLQAMGQSPLQKVGTVIYQLSLVMILIMLPFPGLIWVGVTLTSIILACSVLTMIIYGGFETTHELHIDLRTPNKVLGVYDPVFWADVVQIIRRYDIPHSMEKST